MQARDWPQRWETLGLLIAARGVKQPLRHENAIWTIRVRCNSGDHDSCGRRLLQLSIHPGHRIILRGDWR